MRRSISLATLFVVMSSTAFLEGCLKTKTESSALRAVGPGIYFIKSRQSGKCLDVPSGRVDDGVFLQQWDCNDLAPQKFRLTPTDNGYVRLENIASGKAVDAYERGTADGTPIQQYGYGGGENQQFRLVPREEGSYAIIGRAAGRAIDVKDKSNASGAKIQLWTDYNTTNQQWFFIPTDAGGANPPPAPKPTPAPAPGPGPGPNPNPNPDGWRLVWSDEFNGNQIDQSKWGYENLRPGTVNHERQGYTSRPENARVEGGNLVIETRKDNFDGMQYTSARLITRGKASWKYGRIEARIKITSALGSWPAFWMMPEDQSGGWPACGEIDIMEQVGYEGDTVHGTTHTQRFFGGNGRGAPRSVPNITADFHTYRVDWYADRIEWYVDGQQYFVQRNDGGNDVYPFHKNFHIILNFALGGDWGGARGFDENMPNQRMLVDFVRVYQR